MTMKEYTKLEEKIHKMELAIVGKTTKIEAEQKRQAEIASNLYKMTKEMHKEIYKNGLITRMDRLEQVEKNRKWTIRSISAAIIAIIIKYIQEIFSN